jgi:uncharacterized membrane protein YeaQ/YmgE (transglycosylase-associated protein family)
MTSSQHNRAALFAVIAGLLITPGLVIFAWHFQILSYARLFQASLFLLPLVFLAVFTFNRYFKAHPDTLLNKRPGWETLGACLVVCLPVTRYPADPVRYLLTLLLAAVLFFAAGAALLRVYESRPGLIRLLYGLPFWLAGLAGVCIYGRMAFFTRPYGDDFCFANWLRADGFWQTLSNFYMTWSGRVFSNLFMFGVNLNRSLPFIEIVLLVALVYVTLRAIRSQPGEKISPWAMMAALYLPFAIFSILPDPYKSLYWLANNELTVPVSLVWVAYTGFMAHGFRNGFKYGRLSNAAAFFLALAVSNGHEIILPASMLVTAAFLVSAFFRRSTTAGMQACTVSLWALAGAVVGALVLLLAPGNYARMASQGYPPIPGVFNAVAQSLGYYADFLARLLSSEHWVVLPGAAAVGFLSKNLLPRSYRLFAIIFMGLIGSTWGGFLVSAFATSSTLQPRTQFIPILVLIFGLFALGAVFPQPKPQGWTAVVAAASLLIFGLVFTQVIADDVKLVAPIAQFSSDWDARDALLRSTDAEPYAIHTPWDATEQEMNCLAQYYSKY